MDIFLAGCLPSPEIKSQETIRTCLNQTGAKVSCVWACALFLREPHHLARRSPARRSRSRFMQGFNSAQIHWLPDPFLLSRFKTRSYRRGSGFILFRRYESSAKNAEHPMRGRGPRKTLSVAVSGVAPVRPRGPSTMSVSYTHLTLPANREV